MNFPMGRWKLRNGLLATLQRRERDTWIGIIDGKASSDGYWLITGENCFKKEYDLVEFIRNEQNYETAIRALSASSSTSELRESKTSISTSDNKCSPTK